MASDEECQLGIDVLLNSFWAHSGGVSGGDQMSIQIFGRLNQKLKSICFYTSHAGAVHVKQNCSNLACNVSPKIIDSFGMAVSYLFRALILIPKLIISKNKIIYAGSDFFPDVYPAYITKALRPKKFWIQCIFHIYPSWRERPGNVLLNFMGSSLQQVSIILAKRADFIICINSQVKNYLISKKIDEAKLKIIYPGVDINHIDSISSKYKNENLDGIYLGRLNPSKGVLSLSDIWRVVIKKFPNSKLFIIGDGPQKLINEMLTTIKLYKLENNIVIMGHQPKEAIYELMKKTKVFVFPSNEEGFGIVIVEALACGQRVVAWDLNVYEELFGDAIERCPKGDIESFGQKINEIFSDKNLNNFDQRERIGTYSLDSQAKRLYDLLMKFNCI